MDERLQDWHPSQSEVDDIILELRPLIQDFARRDRETLDVEIGRRRRAAATQRCSAHRPATGNRRPGLR